MPINSTITQDIIHTEISGELNLNIVIQHIEFINSIKDKLADHYELHDFTNVKSINLSSDDMEKIASYSMQRAVFRHSCIAIYANNELAFGMARMFVAYFEMAEHPAIIRIFKNKENARQFLRDETNKNGQPFNGTDSFYSPLSSAL